MWSKNISYIPQNDFFVDSSILNNIILGSKETAFDKKRLDWVCKIAMIDEFLNDKKLSLELNMGENGSNFSGGQKQRIGIARGIYRKSDILIFDESTSALDYETESKLLNNIFKELKIKRLFL